MKRASFVNIFLKCLTVMVIAAASVAAQSKKDKENEKKLRDAADKSFLQKDYRGAVDNYSKAIALIATNPYSHYWKGFAHYYLKEYDPAVTELTLALSQGWDPLKIYRVRAFSYNELKNYDAAIADIKKGLALTPNDLALMRDLGITFYTKDDMASALDAFQKAVKVAPNDADLHYNLALIYFRTGNVSLQGIEADTALAKGTRLPGEAFYLLGDASQKQKNAAAAIDAYQKAINSKPDIYLSYRNLAEIFRSEGRLNDAIAVSKKGLIAFPNDGNIYTDLSWYYSLVDRPDDAVQAAKAGISILPNVYTAYTNLCRAYNDIKSFDQAIIACNTALKLNPKDGETYYYLGRAFDTLGRTAEANSAFKKAVIGLVDYTNSNPEYSDGFYLLGNAYISDRQRDRAEEAYLKCLALSPRFVKAKVNLGLIYVFKKNKPSALKQYDELLKLDPAYAAKLKAEIDKM